jgi:predicted CXXCH cytochrome family protein
LAVGLVGLLATAACTNETIKFVEVQLPRFNPPPDAVNGFLGYYTASEKLTTCGGCHVGKQTLWLQTKHASAYENLEASGHAQDTCRPCHTVNELGNALDTLAGFNAVPDTAYFDVQCESCHGPGLGHVEGPEAIQPLPSIAVDTALKNGCGECHRDTHHPFVEEWETSKHGYGGTTYLSYYNRDPCKNCHESREALRVNFEGFDPRPSGQAGGPLGVYVEASIPDAAQPTAVCAVCHDPHDPANEHQLRAPVDVTTEEQLCVHCHRREPEPEPGNATRRGPHGAQGSIVVDELAGWLPPNWPYTGKLMGTHATACAQCHVAAYQGEDAAGNTVYSTGHTFEAIACIDQTTGLPSGEEDCAFAERNFMNCATSGCHGSEAAARSAFLAVRSRMDLLTDFLWADTDRDSVMETTDGGLLPEVLAQAVAQGNLDEINLYNTVLTTAEGAIWNAQLAFTHEREYWSRFTVAGQRSCDNVATPTCTATGSTNTAHKSSGEGAHNPFLLEALLVESIRALQDEYGVTAPATLDLAIHAAPPAGLTRR